jgi:hypothetical protein
MSDLDTELRGLREELNAAIPLPDFERVIGRARIRRGLQLAAIAAVVAVVAVAVPLVRAARSVPPATTPDAKDTSYILDFADLDHGYALARKCPRSTSGCAFTLYRTTDGGQTWALRYLPPALDPETGYGSATMYVLGPDAVLVDRPMRDGVDRTYSTDGGRSWHWVQTLDTGATAPLPHGALLTTRCGPQPYTETAGCPDVGTIQPRTGRFVATPTQPPLVAEQIGPSPTQSGGYWVVGRSRTTDEYGIAVSADSGRTWSVDELGLWGPDGPLTWSVVENTGVMYLLASSSVGALRVWSSTDGGKSWTFVYSEDSGPQVVGSPVAAGDGSLLVSDGMSTWKSGDGGRTFVKTEDQPFGVKWTRAGYLWLKVDRFELSGDGMHWWEFRVR